MRTPKLKCMVKDCDHTIDPQRDWEQVIGFTHKRVAGGTNALAQKEPTGYWMCNAHMIDLQNGISPNQGRLL